MAAYLAGSVPAVGSARVDGQQCAPALLSLGAGELQELLQRDLPVDCLGASICVESKGMCVRVARVGVRVEGGESSAL